MDVNSLRTVTRLTRPVDKPVEHEDPVESKPLIASDSHQLRSREKAQVGAVGLLYVGAILFLNGTISIRWIHGKSAAPLNIFVGLLQVVTPTYLIINTNVDMTQIFGEAGLYMFGFTYLYVARNLMWNLDGSVRVLSWLLEAIPAVIWLYGAFLSLLFVCLLARERTISGDTREQWRRFRPIGSWARL